MTTPVEINATAGSILGFLEKEPMTGWDLAAKVEEIIGDFWNVTRSQIYRELKVLAEQGLVSSLKAGPRDRQPYRITEAGRRAFRRWIAEPPGPPNMRLPLVLQVFFAEDVAPGCSRSPSKSSARTTRRDSRRTEASRSWSNRGRAATTRSASG